MKDINIMSHELQNLYVEDPLFRTMMRRGAHAEDIILAMWKRNNELSIEFCDLQMKCTCQMRSVTVNAKSKDKGCSR